MASFDKLSYFLRAPAYPVIVDIDGVLVAAKSAKTLYEKLSPLELVEKKNYSSIDRTGDPWIFVVMDGTAVLSPFTFEKPRTKLDLIRWFNHRKNKPVDEVEYSEKSLSSKRRDFIIAEIADRLLDAQKRSEARRVEARRLADGPTSETANGSVTHARRAGDVVHCARRVPTTRSSSAVARFPLARSSRLRNRWMIRASTSSTN